MQTGIYEQLINTIISNRLAPLPENRFYVHRSVLDKQEAARYLSQYVADTIQYALNEVHNDDRPHSTHVEIQPNLI